MVLIILPVLIVFIFAGFLSYLEGAILSYNEEKEEFKFINIKDVPKRYDFLHDEFETIYSAGEILKLILFSLALLFTYGLAVDYLNRQEFYPSGYPFYAIITSIFSFIAIFYWIFCIQIARTLGEKYWYIAPGFISASGYFIYSIVNPVFKILDKLTTLFLKPFKAESRFSIVQLSKEQIKELIQTGMESGAIEADEHEILENALTFSDLRAKDIMIPRTEIKAVKLTGNDNDDFNEIIKSGFSSIPVYKDSLDNILGIVHVKEMMRTFITEKAINLSHFIRPPHYVPENKYISEILKDMQLRGEEKVIVTDEYGGTEGVIVLEDILSEIVGDIKQDGKHDIPYVTKAEDQTCYILGSTPIETFNEETELELPESEEYNTVAGFILSKTGEILNIGDKFDFDGLTFELIRKEKQKMVEFRLTVSPIVKPED